MWLIHFQKEERARQEEKETKESSEYEHQRNVSPKIVTNMVEDSLCKGTVIVYFIFWLT